MGGFKASRGVIYSVMALAVAGAGVIVGQSTSATDKAVSPSGPVIENELKALVDKVYPAVVMLTGGSGVCISADGYVITNHHVASGATRKYGDDGKPVEIPVMMAGNAKYLTARPVAADPRGDIVLLKIVDAEGPLPFIPFADSDQVQVGDLAIAVGNPHMLSGNGAEPSVSLGVVSMVGRYQGGYSNCIQVDAPVNPGNSGGPSFNIKGEIIGINGRILTRHGQRYNTGAGFVIPANQISRFLDVFKAQPGGAILTRHGLVSGLAMVQDKRMDGCEVLTAREDSNAKAADFRTGDVVVNVGDYPVKDWRDFYGAVCTWPLGAEVAFTVIRDGKEVVLHAVLDAPVVHNQMPLIPRVDDPDEDGFIFQHIELPENEPSMFAIPQPKATLGISLEPDEAILTEIRIAGFTKAGSVFITNAAEHLQAGDILTGLNGRKIKYLVEVRDCLLGFKPGERVKLQYLRDGQPDEVEITLG